MPSRYLKRRNLRKGHAAESLRRPRAGSWHPTHRSHRAPDLRPANPEADDDWSTRDGLVLQGDGVTWEAIDALFDLAIAADMPTVPNICRA
jgi:hypothetical protein